jgi:LPS-assembly protein
VTRAGQIRFEAGALSWIAGDHGYFSGGVVIDHPGATLSADKIDYDPINDQAILEGGVHIVRGGEVLSGTRAQFQLQPLSGQVEGLAFYFQQLHASGQAEEIALHSAGHSRLSGVSYTTCPADSVTWQLRAARMVLDEAANSGEAWHVILAIHDLPLLYLPYLNFPLAGRKSGLLTPGFTHSRQNGYEISLPYYLNLAPNYDATITPRWIAERGMLWQGEARHLAPWGRSEALFGYLDNDQQLQQSRHHIDVNFRGGQGAWRSELRYQQLSDSDYRHHFGGDRSQLWLERHAEISYLGDQLHFILRTEHHLPLNSTPPWSRQPQILFDWSLWQRRGWRGDIGGEWVYFNRSDQQQPAGLRLELNPRLAWRHDTPASFLEPRIEWRNTWYLLDDNRSLWRSLPLFSLDSGLFFERPLAGERQQTLEPRLKLIHVPQRDQQRLPIFDTLPGEDSLDQLFANNRYSGGDRIGDTTQASASLTSRYMDGGQQLAALTLGQAHYLRERRVTLEGESPRRDYSDLIAELSLTPHGKWRFGITSHWQPGSRDWSTLRSQLVWQRNHQQAVRLGWREQANPALAQSEIAIRWPLLRQWQGMARWIYDHQNTQTQDQLIGLMVESCCWSSRLIARGERNLGGELDHTIHFMIELKGLTRLGRPFEQQLASLLFGE